MSNAQAPTATMVRLESARHAIAAEVRAELARQNKTLRDAAEALGMHASSLHLRVKGDVSFRADELVLLADALGVPAEQFLRIASVAAAVAGVA